MSTQVLVWVANGYSIHPYYQGSEDGLNLPEALWSGPYDSDYSKVRDWEVDVVAMFKGGKGSDEKAYNECAMDEAQKVINEKIQDCIDPKQYAGEGENAADVIMTVFTSSYCTMIQSIPANVMASPAMEMPLVVKIKKVQELRY